MVVLFNAGDQIPIIPFKEDVGKAGKVVPEQIGAKALNVGVTLEFTGMVIVVYSAH